MDANQRHAQAQHEVRQTSREDAPTGWRKKARLPEEWAEGQEKIAVRLRGWIRAMRRRRRRLPLRDRLHRRLIRVKLKAKGE